jgi:DNA-binding CsgD family transcriptional regulator
MTTGGPMTHAHSVHWRAAEQVLATARMAGLETRTLVRGLALEASPLAASRWIAWDDYCVLVERVEAACGGPAAIERLALDHVAFNEIKALAGAFVSPTQLYAFVFRVIDPICFPCIRFDFSELDGGRIRVETEIKPGARGCMALMRATIGAMRAVPTHLGLPPAEVEAELDERRSIYVARPPASRTMFARARRRSEAALDSLTALLSELSSENVPPRTVPAPATTVEAEPSGDALQSFRTIHGLSTRQSQVLRELIAGCANKDIASRLGCAESTVELHVTALLRKLGVQSRAQLISKYWTDTGTRAQRQ